MPELGSPDAENASPSEYVAETPFERLSLSPEVQRGIEDRGYKMPTPVQARAIPAILSGKDLIIRSKTGTGKTAAFGIPLAERLRPGEKKPQAIVLCPTRELALQVCEEVAALSRHKGLRVAAIYGGASMKAQMDALEQGTEVIVGTPGRVYDHLRRKTLDLSKVDVAILDEADEMLNQGFYEEVTRILDHLPPTRQMLLLSATVPPDIDRLIQRFCREPESILVSGDELTVEGIQNVIYYTVDAYPKPRNLIYLLDIEQPDNAIIFCNTRDDTSLVTAVLNRHGFDAEVLNGDLPQSERERVMAKVKRGELDFLVATDIAARGIDISDLSHVINYSLPEDPAGYLHRVGRTGRIGKKGVAISLVSGRELVTLTALEKRFGIHFEERKLPDPDEARRRWTERHMTLLRDSARGAMCEPMVPLAQDVKAQADGDQVVAFLLKYFFGHYRMERAQQRGAAVAAREEREARRSHDRDKRREDRRRAQGVDRSRERPEGAPREEGDRHAEPSVAGQGAQGLAPADDLKGTRLWCNLGASDHLETDQIIDVLAKQAGIGPDQIRAVDRKSTYSYLLVDPSVSEPLLAMSGTEREGKKLKIERPRQRR